MLAVAQQDVGQRAVRDRNQLQWTADSAYSSGADVPWAAERALQADGGQVPEPEHAVDADRVVDLQPASRASGSSSGMSKWAK